MTNIILHGCGGKMGRVIEEILSSDPTSQIVAGIDPRGGEFSYPVFTSIKDCNVAGDVIIDFSTAIAVPSLLAFAKEKKIPLVLCTTGLSEDLNEEVMKSSKETACQLTKG